MQFSRFFAATAAFSVAVAVQFTNSAFNSITAGQSFTFTWSGATGAVTLTLKDGATTNLQTVSTIASGVTGTSYVWDVPATLAANTYAVEIEDSTGVPNYSPQFQLIGGVTGSSSAPSSTTAISSSSSASSSFSSSSSFTSTTSASNSTTTATKSSSSSSKSSSASTTSSQSTSIASSTTTAAGTTSSTSAPSSASGLSSPLAFVFLALAAILTLN